MMSGGNRGSGPRLSRANRPRRQQPPVALPLNLVPVSDSRAFANAAPCRRVGDARDGAWGGEPLCWLVED